MLASRDNRRVKPGMFQSWNSALTFLGLACLSTALSAGIIYLTITHIETVVRITFAAGLLCFGGLLFNVFRKRGVLGTIWGSLAGFCCLANALNVLGVFGW